MFLWNRLEELLYTANDLQTDVLEARAAKANRRQNGKTKNYKTINLLFIKI